MVIKEMEERGEGWRERGKRGNSQTLSNYIDRDRLEGEERESGDRDYIKEKSMKWVYAQSLLFSINGRAFTDKTGHLRKKFSLFRGGNLKNKKNNNKKNNPDTCIMYIKFRLSLRFEFRNDLENLIEKKM